MSSLGIAAIAVWVFTGCNRAPQRQDLESKAVERRVQNEQSTASAGVSATNRIGQIVSRLLEEPDKKEPPTNRVPGGVAPESRIAGDPRQKVLEAMEQVVKHADRELTLLTRERHDLELRLRETDPAVRDAFSSFVRSRDEYYRVLEGNPEYQKAKEKEAEAYVTLTNAMARLDAIKEGSRKK